MKRFLLLAPIVLILFVGLCLPVSHTSGVNEITLQQKFIQSADGDESTASITSFSTTLGGLSGAPDVLQYPDAFYNSTENLAVAGDAGPSVDNTTAETYVADASYYSGYDNTGALAELWLNFTVSQYTEKIYWYISWGSGDELIQDLWFYNFTLGDWYHLADLSTSGSYGWENSTSTDSSLWDTDGTVMFYFNSSDTPNPHSWASIDYMAVQYDYMTNAGSNHYAESFADVSDLAAITSAVISTNGDIVNCTSTQVNDGMIITGLSLSAQYVELYYYVNGNFGFDIYDGSWHNSILSLTSGTWTTAKANIASYGIITQMRVRSWGSGNRYFYADYLRVGPADEMGWSHDGSTTQGITYETSDWTYSISSDSDILTMTMQRGTSSDSSGWVKIPWDITTTVADIDRDYYPFGAMNWSITDLTAGSYVRVYPYLDGYAPNSASEYFSHQSETATFSYKTSRTNLRAMTWATTSDNGLLFYYNTNAQNQNVTIKMDWCNIDSIANYTITQHASTPTDHYLYVDNGVLCRAGSHTNNYWIQLQNDFSLSVNGNTYTVWNITSPNINPNSGRYDIGIRYAYGVWTDWVFDNSRGAMPAGTVTAFQFITYNALNVSALKFIEDATAPSVVRSWANPIDADDSEAITLSAVVTDTVEVYTVSINALVYPSGFSDTDYSMNEQSSNLWNYTFSSMTAGHYTFAITASDGANTNSMTEYAYIDFDVRQLSLDVDIKEVQGSPEVYTQMEVHFDSNKAGTWTIREWKEADASDAADTNTGVVVSGGNNIAWDKLSGFQDQVIYYNMTIASGSESFVYGGQYSVAKTTFFLEWASDPQESLLQVTISGRITKTGAYAIYDADDNLKTTGTITNRDFKITFDKWVVRDQNPHPFEIRFSNGSQVCWYNGTYYGTIEEQGGGVVVGPAFTVEFWFTMLIIISAVVGVGKVIGKGNIPNYGGTKR